MISTILFHRLGLATPLVQTEDQQTPNHQWTWSNCQQPRCTTANHQEALQLTQYSSNSLILPDGTILVWSHWSHQLCPWDLGPPTVNMMILESGVRLAIEFVRPNLLSPTLREDGPALGWHTLLEILRMVSEWLWLVHASLHLQLFYETHTNIYNEQVRWGTCSQLTLWLQSLRDQPMFETLTKSNYSLQQYNSPQGKLHTDWFHVAQSTACQHPLQAQTHPRKRINHVFIWCLLLHVV